MMREPKKKLSRKGGKGRARKIKKSVKTQTRFRAEREQREGPHTDRLKKKISNSSTSKRSELQISRAGREEKRRTS